MTQRRSGVSPAHISRVIRRAEPQQDAQDSRPAQSRSLVSRRTSLVRSETLWLPRWNDLDKFSEALHPISARARKRRWGPAYAKETHYLRIYLAQLRRKLEDDPSRPNHLLTKAAWAIAFRE